MENKDQQHDLGLGLDLVTDVIANEDQEHSDTGLSLSGSGKQHTITDTTTPMIDPDSVCRQLESVNLTEEETDILLKDALQLNRILKAHLSKQQGLTKKSQGKSTPDGKKKKSRPRPSTTTTSSRGSSSSGGDLPPLDTRRGLSAAQMRVRLPQKTQQRGTSCSSSKDTETRSTQSAEASKATRSKPASSKATKRSKSTESNKKEWNDRW